MMYMFRPNIVMEHKDAYFLINVNNQFHPKVLNTFQRNQSPAEGAKTIND